MDTPAGLRCDFTVQSQFNDFDGVLHVAGLLPWRIKLVVDVGYGERSPRAQQRRNNGPRSLGLRSSGAAAGRDDRRNAELRWQLPVRRGRVLGGGGGYWPEGGSADPVRVAGADILGSMGHGVFRRARAGPSEPV